MRAALNMSKNKVHCIGTDDKAVSCLWHYNPSKGPLLEDKESYAQATHMYTTMCIHCSRGYHLPSEWVVKKVASAANAEQSSDNESGGSASSESDIELTEAPTMTA